AAGELSELGPADVTQYVDEEEAVLGGRVADAEHGPVPGGAVDVRDPEVVPHDGHVTPRAVGALRAPEGAEARVLVVAAQLRRGEPGRRVEQVAVHRELVVVVRRA